MSAYRERLQPQYTGITPRMAYHPQATDREPYTDDEWGAQGFCCAPCLETVAVTHDQIKHLLTLEKTLRQQEHAPPAGTTQSSGRDPQRGPGG